ncbi:MAG: phospholipase D-like domain-containing protein [archaeon]|nr:phospholipase D-like domain-containing protein [archaeon]
MECQEYARYMEDVFENDFTTVWGDVRPFNDLYPDSRPYGTLPFVEPRSGLGDGFEARVRPVLSPDNSFDSLRGIISGAEERLYAEQMDLGGSLSSVSGETPVAWLSQASSRGVDTKFILDSSQSDSGTHRTYVNLISSTTSVQAVNVNGGDGFSLIHNKGLVIDDQVWIGSVNWTDTSFMNNRESAVIIESREVSDLFAELFLKDFGVNVYTVEERGMDITVRVADAGGRPMMVLSVDAPADHEYVWTVDGEKVPFTGNVALGEMSAGTHMVTVTMADTEISASAEFVIPERNGSGGNGMLLPALLCGMGVLALGVVVAVFRDRQEARRRRPSSRQVFAPPRRVTYSFRSGGRRR